MASKWFVGSDTRCCVILVHHVQTHYGHLRHEQKYQRKREPSKAEAHFHAVESFTRGKAVVFEFGVLAWSNLYVLDKWVSDLIGIIELLNMLIHFRQKTRFSQIALWLSRVVRQSLVITRVLHE